MNINKETKEESKKVGMLICIIVFLVLVLGRGFGLLPDWGISQFKPVQSVCDVSPKFPDSILQWCNLITKYAHEEDLKPDLVASVMMQESWFPKTWSLGYERCPNGPNTPSCTSKSGAIGIMQVMPRDGIASTFICENGPCFSNRPPIKKLRDPEFNIKFGTRHLAQCIKREGTVKKGLMAYHGSKDPKVYANKVKDFLQEYGAN